MVVTQVARDVDEVAHSPKAQGQLDPHAIGKGAGEEAHNAEGRVESNIGIVGCGSTELTTTAQSVESVEHARAQKADECDQAELGRRRGIGRKGDGTKAASSIHPRSSGRRLSGFTCIGHLVHWRLGPSRCHS